MVLRCHVCVLLKDCGEDDCENCYGDQEVWEYYADGENGESNEQTELKKVLHVER